MRLNFIKIAMSILLSCASTMLCGQVGDRVSALTPDGEEGAISSSMPSATLRRSRLDVEIHFRFDKYDLDTEYLGNDVALAELDRQIAAIGLDHIDSIVVISHASPEGVYEHNIRLSQNRSKAMRTYMEEHHPELSDKLYARAEGESWHLLRDYVVKDTKMKQSTIEQVLAVIDADINVGTKKWRMEQLPIYRYLRQTYYPLIRNSMICVLYYTEPEPTPEPEPEPTPEPEPIPEPEPVVEEVVEVIPEPTWSPRLLVKTNLVGAALGMTNGAVELDIVPHLSVALPVYYSAWNYFVETTKFRTLAIQPELRYWFSPDNDGFFAGAHFGWVQYNFAFGGDYRYQDHNGTSPALGGGLSVGYRMPISSNKRLRLEFSLGAGGYSVHYDRFVNTPETKDGLRVDTHKTTYWGLDRAAVTFSYSFDLKGKGGER